MSEVVVVAGEGPDLTSYSTSFSTGCSDDESPCSVDTLFTHTWPALGPWWGGKVPW